MTGLLAASAVGVALIYFTIAAIIVPKINLGNATPRFVWLFRAGAALFFVGCGLTHMHIAVHTITDGPTGGHELGFHVLQLAGGVIFIVSAIRYFDITIEPREQRRHEREIAALERLTVRDELTGAYNRRHYDRTLGEEIGRHKRYGQPVSVIRVDIDRFKDINDSHGHPVGDRVLRAFVTAAQATVRPYDSVARIGGDEFAIVLPHTTPDQALRVAERLIGTLKRTEVEPIAGIAVSAGIAGCPADSLDALSLDARADAALYAVKRAGGGHATRAGNLAV